MTRLEELNVFLKNRTAIATEQIVWTEVASIFKVNTYLGTDLPPLELVSSVRGIFTDSERVMLMRNTDETHIMPGGRREPGETFEQTLSREIAEETGWLTGHYQVLGFWHFHNIAIRPAEIADKHPGDFLQLIYVAWPIEFRPDLKLADDYEVESRFVSVQEILAMTFNPPSQLLFLSAALGQSG